MLKRVGLALLYLLALGFGFAFPQAPAGDMLKPLLGYLHMPSKKLRAKSLPLDHNLASSDYTLWGGSKTEDFIVFTIRKSLIISGCGMVCGMI